MARGATSWSKRLKAQKRASETIKRWHWSMETKSFTSTYEKYDCIESRAINCPRIWVVDWNVRTWDLRLHQGPKFNWLSLLGSSFPHNTEKRGAVVTECLLLVPTPRALNGAPRRQRPLNEASAIHRALNTCALLYDKATKAMKPRAAEWSKIMIHVTKVNHCRQPRKMPFGTIKRENSLLNSCLLLSFAKSKS